MKTDSKSAERLKTKKIKKHKSNIPCIHTPFYTVSGRSPPRRKLHPQKLIEQLLQTTVDLSLFY